MYLRANRENFVKKVIIIKRQLEKEDFDRLSRTLHYSWNDLFMIMKGSYINDDGKRYVDLLKNDLHDLEQYLPHLIIDYLNNGVVFDKESLKNWLFQNVVCELLGCCDEIRLQSSVDWLYNKISIVIDPYFRELLPEKENNCYVIETTLSIVGEAIVDHQSRVLKVDNWDNYCRMFEEYDGVMVNYYPSITELNVPSIPIDAEIQSIFHDNQRLRCEIKLRNGWIEKVLAYKCNIQV